MSNKRLVAAKAYLPIRGVNFDSNSLSMGEDESSSVSNLRVLPNEVRTRGGSRRIARNAPDNNPIIHTHNYKTPTGTEILFGFTKNGIFQLNAANGTWTGGAEATLIDKCDSLTNWTTAAGLTLTLTGSNPVQYEGTNLFQVSGVIVAVAAGDLLLGRANLSSLNLTSATHITFMYFTDGALSGAGSSLALTLETYSGTGFTTLLESVNFSVDTTAEVTPGEPAGRWRRISIPITSALYASMRSFKLKFNESFTMIGSIKVDYFAAFRYFTSDISFWSTASFVDKTYGATVVAAGSNPPKINDPEDDGSERVLLYYDQSTSTFKSLVQRETVRTTGVATGADGGGTSKGPFTFTLANAPLVPFSVNLLTGGYRLVDTGAGTFSGDGTGTVNYTTGECTVTFVAGVGAVSADYMYYATVTKYPRFVSNYASRLVMGSTYEDSTTYYPWRIAWSDVADITVVRDDAYSDTVDNDISSIQAFSYSGEYLIIYKAETVIKMRYIGGDSTFGFFTVWRYGLFATRSVIEWNNINFLFGKDDIYMFDGNQFKPLATNRVRNRLFDIVNRDRLQYCFGSFDEKYKEYWLWIVKSGEDYPTEVFVYSIPLDAWTYFQFQPTTCVGAYYSIAGVTIDELIGTIDQQNWALNSGTLEGTVRNPIMCLEAGDAYTYDDRLGEDYIVNDVGTAISYHLITKDFIYSDLPRKDRTHRVQFEAEGTTVTVGHTSRYVQETSAFLNKKTITLTPEHNERRYWPDSVYEKIRLSFEGSGYFSLRWIQTFAITEELD